MRARRAFGFVQKMIAMFGRSIQHLHDAHPAGAAPAQRRRIDARRLDRFEHCLVARDRDFDPRFGKLQHERFAPGRAEILAMDMARGPSERGRGSLD